MHLAVDHESEDDDKMVAMKFMKERAQFLREVRVRALGNFSEVHVMGGIRVHDCDEDPDFRDEAVAKGFVDFPYCFVMHVGERNLGDVMVKEHLAGRDWDQIRMITCQIASAVGHMHFNGFIHGDLKRTFFLVLTSLIPCEDLLHPVTPIHHVMPPPLPCTHLDFSLSLYF